MPASAPKDTRLYFQAHGLTAQAPERLNQALALAIGRMRASVYSESATELTAAESAVLQEGGFDLSEHPGAKVDPLIESVTEFAALLSTGLSTAAVAQCLGVHPSRVRQMLTERTLYGFHIDTRWVIPAFQFVGDALVRGIGPVNAALDPHLHPVVVYRWYTLPEADLDLDGRALAPLVWLKAGCPVDRAVRAAAEL